MNDRLLLMLQQGLPIVARPFDELARRFEMTEGELLVELKSECEKGTFRRLGAVFNAQSLNYRSQLCAVDGIDNEKFDEVVRILCEDPSITHCYLRGWSEQLPSTHSARLAEPFPKIWFTWSEHRGCFRERFDDLKRKLAPATVWELPALQTFKIQVIFGGAGFSSSGNSAKIIEDFSEEDKRLIRVLQGNLDLHPAFYQAIAARCELSEEQVMSKIQHWQEDGVMRRLAFLPRHHRLGYRANAMALWNVSAEEAVRLGPILAANSAVTHCYFRQTFPGFPYGLYAMIHGKSWEELLQIYDQLTHQLGETDAKLLCSLKEYKKTSMRFF